MVYYHFRDWHSGHCPSPRTEAHNVSQAVYTSFSRWNGERKESTLVDVLENATPGMQTGLSNWST